MTLHPNLGACLDASRDPARVAFTDARDFQAPRAFTAGELDGLIARCAGGFLARGLKPGQRVGILSLNRWEFLVGFLGAMRAGLVAVPVSFKLAQETLDYIASDAELALILHDADRAASCPPGVPRLGFDDGGFAALLHADPAPVFMPDARDLCMILYTSGSTGRPKGVLLPHSGQVWALNKALEIYGDLSAERYVVAAPLFHMNATFSATLALAGDASLVMLPAFEAKSFARAIAHFRVTALTSVPTMLALVAREQELLRTLDLSSVRRVMMGSAPLTGALIEKVAALFPGAPITNSYGTTEAGPLVFGPHPKGLPRPPLSVGHPVAGGDAELREGASPDEGVLFMRNPMLMAGYNKLPEKTADALRDGWYRSGDIMRRDGDGWFWFLGRADDMFVVGGENVWPGEVEKLLEKLPGVHQSCVVPVPDEIKGALPFAFVVRQPGATLDEAAVKAHALANGPAFAHPRFVEFVPAIPLAATNKPDRRRLTDEAARLVAERRAAGASR
jgi:acyl-CoA synthetase (AMP-forming)/AMP-acid ligase II